MAGAGSGEASVAGAPGDWPLLTTWLTTMDGSEVVREEEALLEHQQACSTSCGLTYAVRPGKPWSPALQREGGDGTTSQGHAAALNNGSIVHSTRSWPGMRFHSSHMRIAHTSTLAALQPTAPLPIPSPSIFFLIPTYHRQFRALVRADPLLGRALQQLSARDKGRGNGGHDGHGRDTPAT